MSSQLTALSDEYDQQPGTVNGHVAKPNGKHGHSQSYEDSPMSEDDDDLPLSQSTAVKSQPHTPDVRASKRKKLIVEDDSSDEDVPLASSSPLKSAAIPLPDAIRATTIPVPAATPNGRTQPNGKAKRIASDEDDDDDDRPLGNGKRPLQRPPKKKAKTEGASFGSNSDDEPIVKKKAVATKKRKLKAESEADDDSDDDKPLKKKPTARKPRGKRVKDEGEGSGSETARPKKRATKASKAKKEELDASPGKKGKAKKTEEEDEEIHRWWDQQQNGDNSEKWQTLQHNGVYFPPAYEPLPSNTKMKYNGKPVNLSPDAEEVAGFYAALLETDHAKDQVFNKNFFNDWLEVLKKYPTRDSIKIREFSSCDFRPMFEYFEQEKAKKKALTGAEKKELKKAKDELEAVYTYCMLDGRKEKVGNFRVEPPGLFRGRGEHPKKGSLKKRICPEDITINIGAGETIPVPNDPGNWKAVIHDKTVTWLATWVENINGNHKYVFLAAGSSLKGQSDMSKFEKARELKDHVDRIRADYTTELKSKEMEVRQRATAMYLIDFLALRAGNEKGEDEADTVGCCSLRCEHVTLEPPNILNFDFLGKDSIRYYKQVPVDPQVFKNIRIFKENKGDEDNLLDRIWTSKLNAHLNQYMKGLTAKVFRTFNASQTFQTQLDLKTPESGTVQEKLNAYNEANRLVAILCNHQRTAPKTHEQSMEKMKEKIRGLKYERMKLRHVLFGLDKKYKKKTKYVEDESDLDDDAVAVHEEKTREKEIEKVQKKFAKENEKLEAEGEEAQKESVLNDRIEEIEAEFERLKEERGTGLAALKRDKPPEKIEEAILKLEDKINTAKLQMVDREAGKEIALGTSKINYLDPRITVAWCNKHGVPVEKLFSKTLITKFPWAMEVDAEWKF